MNSSGRRKAGLVCLVLCLLVFLIGYYPKPTLLKSWVQSNCRYCHYTTPFNKEFLLFSRIFYYFEHIFH